MSEGGEYEDARIEQLEIYICPLIQMFIFEKIRHRN